MGRRVDSSFATRASPLDRFPFRLHRLLNRSSSAAADGLAPCRCASDVLLFALTVWAFLTRVSTTPAADFCCRIRMNYFTLRHDSETCNRSPEISSTAFCAQPPNLRFASLLDMGFAIIGPLARRSRLRFGSCTLARAFAPRFLQTPPHGDALAPRYHFSSIRM